SKVKANDTTNLKAANELDGKNSTKAVKEKDAGGAAGNQTKLAVGDPGAPADKPKK
ncbi:MAG: hypothetical protein HZA82_07545, partial [Thaumarchaeota archaeon]|nr:hypothetical protein [Nitrososphaerota archaeon]